MLILSRKAGESIIIGDDIEIIILSSKQNLTRIGINAPREIPVYRKELVDGAVLSKPSKTFFVEELSNE